jgi:hypothetical protein
MPETDITIDPGARRAILAAIDVTRVIALTIAGWCGLMRV